MTVASEAGGVTATLSPDAFISAASFDQLHMPELSAAAVQNDEASVIVDGLWQMTSDKQPMCSASLLLQSPHYDHRVAFTTTLVTAVAASSPLPCFAAVRHSDCNHRHVESVNSHPLSEGSVTYTMPVPSDAVLVRPRLPLLAGKHVRSNETTCPPSSIATSFLLLSSAGHDAGSVSVDGSNQESASSAASVYGGGFYAPPVHSSALSHVDDATTASFSYCPHCGVGFPAAAVQRNIVYHPTGPSYVMHSLSPALQPCYCMTVSSTAARLSAATCTASTAAVLPSSVRLPDGIYQLTCTRPPLSVHLPSASPSFISAPPSATGVRVRTARPPPSCANCGHIGHTQLDCKEPTIDTVLNTRTWLTSIHFLSISHFVSDLCLFYYVILYHSVSRSSLFRDPG